MIERLGHVGVWAGLYVGAAYVFFWQLSAAGAPGSWPNVAAIVSVMLAATGVYAIDRVKIADRFLDPADFTANPVRYAFLSRHTTAVRVAAALLIGVAMVVARSASALLPAVIALAAVGVVLYAPGPRGRLPRPKDLLVLKNLFVAGGVVALAVVATAMIGPISRAHGEAFWEVIRQRLAPIGDAAVLLLLRVAIDAVLCDIDDTDADTAFGTQTIPVKLGRRRTLTLAIVARLGLAVLILAISRAPLPVRGAWAGISAASALILILFHAQPLKTRVDVGFFIEAILVSLIAATV